MSLKDSIKKEFLNYLEGDNLAVQRLLLRQFTPSAPAELPAIDIREKHSPHLPKIHPLEALQSLAAIELDRCRRKGSPFCVGIIELGGPQNSSVRDAQIETLWSVFRSSDAMALMSEREVVVLAFDSNRPGAKVLTNKLKEYGFDRSAFGIFPQDGKDFNELVSSARHKIRERMKPHVLVYSEGSLLKGFVESLLDPHCYRVMISENLEEIKRELEITDDAPELLIAPLSREPQFWKFCSTVREKKLLTCPIMLDTNLTPTEGLRKELQKWGVRALFQRGRGGEDFLHMVKDLVIPREDERERKNPRALTTLSVEYRNKDEEGRAKSFTLSRGGIFVRNLHPASRGQIIDLNLHLKDGEPPLRTRGEVVYSVPYYVGVHRFHVPGMACRFLDLNDYKVKRLDQEVDQALSEYLL